MLSITIAVMCETRFIPYGEIKAGMVILYRLRSDQRPRQPAKEWRGKVLEVDRNVQRTIVTSLEVGYEGCQDEVWFEQIMGVEEDTSLSSHFMIARRQD